MVLIVCATAHPGRRGSPGSEARLARTIGDSHYSYQFVLHQFLPVLEALDTVVHVERPEQEVDPIFDRCQQVGERCVFLSFAPPQLTPLGLRCPTIPVFAWEFPDIPIEAWGDDPRSNWQYVFARVGRAITHSRFAADAVRRVMGQAFPILVCPSPVWDRFRPQEAEAAGSARRLTIPPTAFLIDTGDARGAETEPTGLGASFSIDLDGLLEGREMRPAVREVDVGGVVYTSVFNPADFRKNWQRLITSFCRAFRDSPDATLLLKFAHWDHGFYLPRLQNALYKMAPFRCRVLAIGGYLDDAAYEAMVRATTYAINASTGEGQCLPLMEFMSCGKPAIAPCHTAMLDYVDADNSFLVDGILQETGFPQDPRGKLLTTAFQFESDSMVRALRASHAVASDDPARYGALARAATARLEEHCSRRVARDRVGRFLGLERTSPPEQAGLEREAVGEVE